jgi:periplasmic divalent cation tolerance protein
MPEIMFIYATAPDEATADAIAAALVDEGRAACVNILPGVRSRYRWQGAIETAREAAILVKTTVAAAPSAIETIRRLHPYETPAIAAFAAAPQTDAAFSAWIASQTISP